VAAKALNVAVVGSGPAGLYTAEALVKQAAALPDPVRVRVDVLDRLPTPYGLVRYGVAPDHKSIKSIAEYLRKVLESADVRFIGGVHFGDDVTRADLLGAYDAVVYATGAMRDRRLGIPGEDLPGSYAATDFVNWYCGHPDVGPASFTLDAESVAVIGVGNVAVDVARILARDPADLHTTDVSQPVLEALLASKVREVHMIGRRGPAYAKFTTKELRELGELSGVEIVVPAQEADLEAFDATGTGAELAGSDRRVRGNMVAIRKWATPGEAGETAPSETAPSETGPETGPGHTRTLTMRFWLRPVEITGEDRVTGLTVERTRLDENGAFQGTGELETLDVQLVLRSVGYQSVPLDGVPFDERHAVVPNDQGRVLGPDGQPRPGEYVAGWLKRGPTGVIGTNKSDATETVRSLLADLLGADAVDVPLARPGMLRYPKNDDQTRDDQTRDDQTRDDQASDDEAARRAALENVLAGKGIRPVSYADWLRVEAAETDLALALGRGNRVKLHGRDALYAACWPDPPAADAPEAAALADDAHDAENADAENATAD
jgi:ferredoxin--NADP+ reductase